MFVTESVVPSIRTLDAFAAAGASGWALATLPPSRAAAPTASTVAQTSATPVLLRFMSPPRLDWRGLSKRMCRRWSRLGAKEPRRDLAREQAKPPAAGEAVRRTELHAGRAGLVQRLGLARHVGRRAGEGEAVEQ